MMGEEEKPDTTYLVGDVAEWMQRTLADELGINSKDFRKISLAICKKPVKEDIAKMLNQSMLFCGKQNELMQELQRDVAATKTELVSAQRRIIQLQEELLASKDVQLKSLQTTVKTSVEDTVKAEFVSYSAMVQKQPAQTLQRDVVKTLVKTVVEEEDRSRSVMVFGLEDAAAEDLRKKVGDVFLEIGEQPRVEVSRLGKVAAGGKIRPVKVCLSSSHAVDQILSKARQLKQSEKFSKVFISPDRSPAQRIKHRELVGELKKKDAEEPEKKHFIRRGKVVCAGTEPGVG